MCIRDRNEIGKQGFPYGVDVLWVGDDKKLSPYTTLPHTAVLVNLFKEEKPQIAFMGEMCIRDSIRDEAGKILFRPGGHGALIYNVNDIKADIIFIKNIDNVSPDRSKACLVYTSFH